MDSRTSPTGCYGGTSIAPLDGADDQVDDDHDNVNQRSLTIAEAKRGLSLTLGVPESSIKIIVEA